MNNASMVRERMSREARGKVVESLTFDDVGMYWVMSFTDGSEISFLFMSEVRERIEPLRVMLHDVYHKAS